MASDKPRVAPVAPEENAASALSEGNAAVAFAKGKSNGKGDKGELIEENKSLQEENNSLNEP